MIVLLHSGTIIIGGDTKMTDPFLNRGMTIPDDWDNSAEKYAAFASRKALYLESAEAIIRSAEIERGMVILDLACGSGIVTETILRQPYGSDVEIVAVDYSPEMLNRARSRITSPNVQFHQGRAEELSKVVQAKFDRVLCNAAFWHFDKARAFSEICRILKPSGRCLIGIPTQDFKVIDMDEVYQENRVIWMIIEEKALRGYFNTTPPDVESVYRLKTAIAEDKTEILEYMSDADISLKKIETLSIDAPQKDYIDFLRIPVMVRSSFLFKDVPYEETQQILDVVESQLEWVEVSAPSMIWQIFVLESNG